MSSKQRVEDVSARALISLAGPGVLHGANATDFYHVTANENAALLQQSPRESAGRDAHSGFARRSAFQHISHISERTVFETTGIIGVAGRGISIGWRFLVSGAYGATGAGLVPPPSTNRNRD